MGDMVIAGLFYSMGAVILLAAAGAIFSKNIVHSAVLLTVAFLGLAGIYILLQADYLAALQLLVYVGAITILITLGLMLTNRDVLKESNPNNRYMVAGGLLSGVVAAVISAAAVMTEWRVQMVEFSNTISLIADTMLKKYTIAFEVAAVLLLVAMIGAVILAKGADET